MTATYLKEHLRELSRLNMPEKQKRFYQWEYRVSKPVDVVPYKSVPGLGPVVTAFLKRYKPKIKECYVTAWRVTMDIPGVYYIDGFRDLTKIPIPIEHAWNYYKGKYFDLTSEIALKDDVRRVNYLQMLKLNRTELSIITLRTKTYGGYIGDYYLHKILGKKW